MGDSLFLSLPKAIQEGLASTKRLDEAESAEDLGCWMSKYGVI